MGNAELMKGRRGRRRRKRKLMMDQCFSSYSLVAFLIQMANGVTARAFFLIRIGPAQAPPSLSGSAIRVIILIT